MYDSTATRASCTHNLARLMSRHQLYLKRDPGSMSNDLSQCRIMSNYFCKVQSNFCHQESIPLVMSLSSNKHFNCKVPSLHIYFRTNKLNLLQTSSNICLSCLSQTSYDKTNQHHIHNLLNKYLLLALLANMLNLSKRQNSSQCLQCSSLLAALQGTKCQKLY